MTMILPKEYKSALDLRETETAIKKIKDKFQNELSKKLNLMRVSAPLFVLPNTGLNDNLSGLEKAVSFTAPNIIKDENLEIIHSLAKWKRYALKRYNFDNGKGLYTDMNAIRREEEPSNIHSIYVDQWDWERIITREDRNVNFLEEIVNKIYSVFIKVEDFILGEYPELGEKILPDKITFISSQELEDKYPDLDPKSREHEITKKYGAVFITKVGKVLNSGNKHDGRAPDYDDWELNGDILFWYPQLGISIELSSMGIRVDATTLKKQLEFDNALDRLSFKYHEMIMNDELPLTIGGGIGQSRICMYFLKKAHIGEVQSSVWDDETKKLCKDKNINLL